MTDRTIRSARVQETADVIDLLDAALLAFERDAVCEATRRGDVLVAVAEDRILGAVLLEGSTIEAIAVRPRYRRRGIGSALLAEVGADRCQVVAECAPRYGAFYEVNGFDLTEQEDGRLRCVLDMN